MVWFKWKKSRVSGSWPNSVEFCWKMHKGHFFWNFPALLEENQVYWKIFVCFGTSIHCLFHDMVWKGAWEVPPFKSGPPFQIRSPSNLGPCQQFRAPRSPHSASRYYIWSPKIVLIVRWMRGTFEFDQPYKQAESKMQVTGKISSNK